MKSALRISPIVCLYLFHEITETEKMSFLCIVCPFADLMVDLLGSDGQRDAFSLSCSCCDVYLPGKH